MAITRTTEHVRFRYGTCLNDSCEKCKSKEVQEISVRKEFACAECGKPLRECPSPKKKSRINGRLIGVILAAVLVLGGLGAGGYFLWDSHQKSEKKKADALEAAEEAAEKAQNEAEEAQARLEEQEEAARERARQQADEEARRTAIVARAVAKGDSIIAANKKLLEERDRKIRDDAKTIINAQLTSLQTACQTLQYENITLIDTMEVAINESWKNADKPAAAGEGPNPSWGRYQGARKNGKPDGSGILYITRATTINGEDAQPGERIEGVFRNGYVNMGTWFKADGNTVVVKDLKVL